MSKITIYIASITFVLALLIELSCFLYLKSQGLSPSFLYSARLAQANKPEFRNKGSLPEPPSPEMLGIDPLLGYGHAESEENVKKARQRFQWSDGFVIYTKNNILKRPIILTLGGSTTDGIMYGHSWPEELANLLEMNHKDGTVINGGVGGYSTNQELLKLIRDGLEFSPDFVIGYDGLNDRGYWSELPYPMIHPYQRSFFNSVLKKDSSGQWARGFSRIFPSTIALMSNIARSYGSGGLDLILGLKTHLSLAEQYKKNIQLMNVIASSNGARFDAFIQPYALYNSRHSASITLERKALLNAEAASVKDLYKEILILPVSNEFIHDATKILEGSDNVFKADATHLTEEGDKVVAKYMYEFLESKMR